MTHQARAFVVAAFGLLERCAAKRIDRARTFSREEERLSAVQLRLVDVVAQRELATPRPFRLRPRGEARLRRVEGLFVRRGEERGQAAVLREGEDLALREEREGVVQRPQLPVGGEPAVVEPPSAELG